MSTNEQTIKTTAEKREELEAFLIDLEAEEFATALELLLDSEIEKLYNMYEQMKAARKMKTEINFNLKHDIKIYHSGDTTALPRCERSYMFKQSDE